MTSNRKYRPARHTCAPHLCDAVGTMPPHTYGVRPRSYPAISTGPCRPTACVRECPCSPDGEGHRPAAGRAQWAIQHMSHTDYQPITNYKLLITHCYTFSAKEKDVETGLSYFGSRYYSSDLSVWLSVDPMSDKYPSLSPYTYCADNPVKLVDPNGEYLEVADNDDTHNDLLSIVGKTHRDRVIFNKDGSVSVNMEGLSQEAIDKDIGLSLINDMVNSDCKYYFETSDDAFLCNQSGKRTCERIATEKFRGVVNASVYGLDYFGEHRYLPMEGFEGQVVIAKSGQFTLYGENVRKNVVFHELEENFLRTDKRMDYQGGYGVGAHRTAARIENNAWGNFAGQGDYTPPQTPQSKSNDSIMNYINYGIYK